MPEANSEYKIHATSSNLMKFVYLITSFKVAISDRDTVQSMSCCMRTHRHINMGPMIGVSQILGELVTEWSKVL